MALSWSQFSEMLRATNRAGSVDAEESSYPANVLLQIVLPIVLILAFIIYVGLQQFEQKKADYDALEDKVLKEDRGRMIELATQALIDLQKQKLIAALEKVEYERRKFFGVEMFSSVNLGPAGDTIARREFRLVCERASGHLATSQLRGLQMNFIYHSVLDSAGLRDRGPIVPESRVAIMADTLTITQGNKQFILEEILKFTNQLVVEVKQSQYDALRATSDYYNNHPQELETLNPEIAVYRKRYRKAMSPVERSEITASMGHCIVSTLAKQLDKEGFRLFEETWKELIQ